MSSEDTQLNRVNSLGVSNRLQTRLPFLAVVVPLVDLGAPEMKPLSELGDLLAGPVCVECELRLQDLALSGVHTLPRDEGGVSWAARLPPLGACCCWLSQHVFNRFLS